MGSSRSMLRWAVFFASPRSSLLTICGLSKEDHSQGEQRSSSYEEGKLDALSDEKPRKIKKLANLKVIRRIKEKKRKEQKCRPSASDSGSPSRREIIGNRDPDAEEFDVEGEGREHDRGGHRK